MKSYTILSSFNMDSFRFLNTISLMVSLYQILLLMNIFSMT